MAAGSVRREKLDFDGDEKILEAGAMEFSGETDTASSMMQPATDGDGAIPEKDAPSTLPIPGTEELHAGGNDPQAQQQQQQQPQPQQEQQPQPQQAPEETRTRLQTFLIMLSLSAAMFLAALDVTIVTVAIPTISGDFRSTIGYTWIGSAYLLANAAAAPIWGKISDIWGRKQILLLAVAVFWVGSLLSATSVSMSMLIAARAVQGVGGGGIIILVNVCISDLFSMRKRGQYFGIMGMVWAVAGGIGPVLGGAFTSTSATWRWCFYVNLPISGAGFAILLFVLKLHNPRTPMRQGLAAVDWLGSLTIIGGTLMILLGLTLGGVVYPWASATVICLIVFGAVTVVLFLLVEWRVAEFPVIPLRLFRQRAAMASFGCCFFHGFVFISGSYYLPLYFQAVLGASPLRSGAYVLPFSIMLAITSASTGIYIRKTGRYLPAIVFGFVFMTLGFGLFVDLGPEVNWAKLIVFQIVAATGVGPNFQAPLISLQTTVEQRDVASATATFGFIRQLSTSVSVVIGGVVFQNGMQRQYPALLAGLGPQVADLLSGGNAAASVYLVAELQGAAQTEARAAYWNSLRTMYVMYVVFAAVGLVVSGFVTQNKLSKELQVHQTGLKGMKEAKQEQKQQQSVRDEEKAVQTPPQASTEPSEKQEA